MDKWKDSELEKMKVCTHKHFAILYRILCAEQKRIVPSIIISSFISTFCMFVSMQVGGNSRAKDFFSSQPDISPGMSLSDKYNSRAAALYRDKVHVKTTQHCLITCVAIWYMLPSTSYMYFPLLF